MKMSIKARLLFLATICVTSVFAVEWEALNVGIPGTNGTIRSLAIDNTGHLWVGGEFTIAGNAYAVGVATWDGKKWEAVPNAIPEDIKTTINVQHIAMGPSGKIALYMDSDYKGINRSPLIRIYDGSKWITSSSDFTGTGFNSVLSDFFFDKDGALVAAGTLTRGGTITREIVRQSRGNWITLASFPNAVTADVVECPDKQLYATAISNEYNSGSIAHTQFETVTIQGFAKWNGSSWSSMGTAIPGKGIRDIACDSKNRIYVSGNGFFMRWDTTGWTSLLGAQEGFNGRSLFMEDNDHVWTLGAFTLAGGGTVGLMEWDGSAFKSFPSSTDNGMTFLKKGSQFAMAAPFEEYGGRDACGILEFRDSDWKPLGEGIGKWVYGLAVDKKNIPIAWGLYPGAVWMKSGNTWARLSSVAQSFGHILEIENVKKDNKGDLFVIASIKDLTADTVAAVLKWDGISWALLNGFPKSIASLAFSNNGDLYAILSEHETVGGVKLFNGVIKWNGSIWAQVGEAMSELNQIEIAPDGTIVIMGAGRLLKIWDGSSWVNVTPRPRLSGSSTGGYYSGIFFDAHGLLYIFGNFDEVTIDGKASSTTLIATYNLTTKKWSPVGSGNEWSTLASIQSVIEDDQGRIWASGVIKKAFGKDAYSVAVWDGSTWAIPISQVSANPIVAGYALAKGDDGWMYLGGSFSDLDGVPSPYIVRTRPESLPPVRLLEPRHNISKPGKLLGYDLMGRRSSRFWDIKTK